MISGKPSALSEEQIAKFISDKLVHGTAPSDHAFLSPSKHTWLDWDDETLNDRFISSYATQIGTLLHDLAARLIAKRFKLRSTDRNLVMWELINNDIPASMIDIEYLFNNLKQYVNDAISEGMSAEQKIFFSKNCFGTADAVLYSASKKSLKIYDLKTGSTPAHMEQLLIYAALFTLVYKLKPEDISMELRIYQAGEILYYNPTADDIYPIRQKIVHADKVLNGMIGMEVEEDA